MKNSNNNIYNKFHRIFHSRSSKNILEHCKEICSLFFCIFCIFTMLSHLSSPNIPHIFFFCVLFLWSTCSKEEGKKLFALSNKPTSLPFFCCSSVFWQIFFEHTRKQGTYWYNKRLSNKKVTIACFKIQKVQYLKHCNIYNLIFLLNSREFVPFVFVLTNSSVHNIQNEKFRQIIFP